MSDREPDRPEVPATSAARVREHGPLKRPVVSRRPARPALTRDRIVGVAIGVARAEGVAAASMRRIGEELGTSPMAIYRHLADRQELLLAMLDEVAASIVLPDPVDDPRTELTAIMTAAHAAFRRDPWVVELLLVDGLASPLILPAVERVFLALEHGGLTGRAAAAGYSLLWHYLYGETLSAQHDRPDTFARQMTEDALFAYPAIGRVAAALRPTGDRDFFAGNLARLVNGLLITPDETTGP
ncbi:TetR/AcrR family transcriptional regulator [Lentzea sp. JNUCC 0626]|uniref:TetR/AcrR family transcriptional regulator n=1 Tax=Lentzea sp. JNUCC 0626 TaxID=3367513 RepID=UPI003748F9D5